MKVAAQWTAMNGNVIHLGRFWDPLSTIIPANVTLHGNDTFCLMLEQKLGLSLISSDDDLIKRINEKWLRRNVSVVTLKKALRAKFSFLLSQSFPNSLKLLFMRIRKH